MKEKLKALVIPIAVVLYGFVLDNMKYYTDAVLFGVIALLVFGMLALAEAIHISGKLSDTKRFLVNGIVFAVSGTAFTVAPMIKSNWLLGSSLCLLVISSITVLFYAARLWKQQLPQGFAKFLTVVKYVDWVICFAVAFSVLRFALNGERDIFVWGVALFAFVPVTVMATVITAIANNLKKGTSVKTLGRAVALMICLFVVMSSLIAFYYEVDAVSAIRAQAGIVLLGASGQDYVCVHQGLDGSGTYLVFRDRVHEARDHLRRNVYGLDYDSKAIGFLHFFMVIEFTPYKT